MYKFMKIFYLGNFLQKNAFAIEKTENCGKFEFLERELI